jgi:hypothetical protein|tara:strand:+ start:22720 stop:23046 length:327 start_codon:yes stop_codon:yes gene_type:complete
LEFGILDLEFFYAGDSLFPKRQLELFADLGICGFADLLLTLVWGSRSAKGFGCFIAWLTSIFANLPICESANQRISESANLLVRFIILALQTANFVSYENLTYRNQKS